MNYKKEGFNKLTSRRAYYLSRLIEHYDKIIYSDIDTIWKKDPRPYFKGGQFDFWAQIDGVIEGSPYFKGFIPFICTGFLALRSTPITLKLLQKWQNVTAANPILHQDQNVIQRIAFELDANYAVLPMELFPSGRLYFETMSNQDREKIVVLHNNFIVGKEKKITRFKNFHLWALDFKDGKQRN